MNEEKQWLVTNEPIEFEEQPIEVQDFRKVTNDSRGKCRIYCIVIRILLNRPRSLFKQPHRHVMRSHDMSKFYFSLHK